MKARCKRMGWDRRDLFQVFTGMTPSALSLSADSIRFRQRGIWCMLVKIPQKYERGTPAGGRGLLSKAFFTQENGANEIRIIYDWSVA